MTLLKTEIVGTTLDLVLGIVGHDSLMMPVTASQPGTPLGATGALNADGTPSMHDMASYAAGIRHTVGQQGFQLASVLLNGLVTQFSPEVMPVAITTLKVLSSGFAGEMVAWVPGIVEQLPSSYVPDKDKLAFTNRYLAAVNVASAWTRSSKRSMDCTPPRVRRGRGPAWTGMEAQVECWIAENLEVPPLHVRGRRVRYHNAQPRSYLAC